MSSPILQKFNVLIFDPDTEMANVLKSVLQEMGFTNILVTNDESSVYTMLKNNSIDFLITEWSKKSHSSRKDGLELLTRIRKDPMSPNPALPVVMLTARAENADVLTARDHGINEYVVKPYSAKSLFARLERLIEHPRSFVATPGFTGPDRRGEKPTPPGISNRRNPVVEIKKMAFDAAKANNDNSVAQIWVPDFSLKQKLGDIKLSAIITPEVLANAQKTIEEISDKSIEWIREDLSELKSMHKEILQSNDVKAEQVILMGEKSLQISARAGTFGYQNAAKAGYMLYLFCKNQLDPNKPVHCVIAEKHIEVLQVALSDASHKFYSIQDMEILDELQKLSDKFGT